MYYVHTTELGAFPLDGDHNWSKHLGGQDSAKVESLGLARIESKTTADCHEIGRAP